MLICYNRVMIEIHKVSKVFGKKTGAFTALNNVSATIPDNASVAIVGKSGSGKSTLMHVMSGLDRATSGSVTFDGRNITKMKGRESDAFRANEMSFIFQAFFVEANRTCIENVMLPLEIAEVPLRSRRTLALKALTAVDLLDKAAVKAGLLSGGQKQRLAIARAIVNKPKLLFADEPTGNLDSVNGENIMNLLFELNKKMSSTLVIVTHDHELAARCDMQLYLKDGEVEKIINSKTAKKRGAK